MFTGLIDDVGTLLSLIRQGSEAEIKVSTSYENFVIGESIAVMGACLTVTGFSPGWFAAFASRETMDRTGLIEIPAGAKVNLERALKVGDRVGGHMVTGHVDARVKVLARNRIGKAHKFTIALPQTPLDKQIAPKGSIAIDGVSLTVNEVDKTSFDVMVIPITVEHTTLGGLKPGDTVNIETDVLAKYVARQLARGDEKAGGVDLDLLERSGFMR